MSALAFPKPVGALNEVWSPRSLVRDLDPIERRALREIADHADHIADVVDDDGRRLVCVLVAVPQWVINALLTFEGDREDLGVDADLEPASDDEPSLGAPERFSQKQWAQNCNFAAGDIEADNADAEEETDGADLPYELGRGRRLSPVYEAAAD